MLKILLRKRVLLTILLTSLQISLVLAGDIWESSVPTEATSKTITETKVYNPVTGINAFGLNALSVVLATNATGNQIISPLSLASVLGMTAQGAQAETAADFAQLLGFDPAQQAAATQAIGALGEALVRQDDEVTLSWSNGLWLAADLPLQPAFAEVAQTQYSAQAATVDFSAAETLGQINGWFEQATQGMITNLLTDLPTETRIVLGNTLYFKGRWLNAFNPELTKQQPFHDGTGGTLPVAMMSHPTGEILYSQTEHYQAVRLPFANSAFELLVALPAKGLSVEQLLAVHREQTTALLAAEGFKPLVGKLHLPQLNCDIGGDVKPVLEALGLSRAFSDQAQFGGISSEPLQLEQVIHRVTFTLDEAGAEAAAATAVLGTRSALIVEPFEMIVDRPFLLALRHALSGGLLFIGRITAPQPPVGA